MVAGQDSERSIGAWFLRGLHRRMAYVATSKRTCLGALWIHHLEPEAFCAMIVCGVWGGEVGRRRG